MPANGAKKRRLTAKISGGRLLIEIGVDTLAHAATHLDYRPDGGQSMPPPNANITSPTDFACDVVSALLDEAEDGSNILTIALDQAITKAIEDGSEHYDSDEVAKTPGDPERIGIDSDGEYTTDGKRW